VSRGAALARHGELRRRKRPRPLGRGCAGGADAGEGEEGWSQGSREEKGMEAGGRRRGNSAGPLPAPGPSWPRPCAAGGCRATGRRAGTGESHLEGGVNRQI
jgi:hypothetical protein